VVRAETKRNPALAHNFVSREEILAQLHEPALLLVNVMPKETFEAGHIPLRSVVERIDGSNS